MRPVFIMYPETFELYNNYDFEKLRTGQRLRVLAAVSAWRKAVKKYGNVIQKIEIYFKNGKTKSKVYSQHDWQPALLEFIDRMASEPEKAEELVEEEEEAADFPDHFGRMVLCGKTNQVENWCVFDSDSRLRMEKGFFGWDKDGKRYLRKKVSEKLWREFLDAADLDPYGEWPY